MGMSMFVLASTKIENSKVFHDYRVWKKHLKENSLSSFFVKYSDEIEKEINYRSTDVLFKYFNECEENKVLDNIFIFRESEKNLKMTPVFSFFVMVIS